MRLARALPLLLLLAAGAARAQAPVPARLAPWLESANEQRLARAFVPSAERRVGEVRVLARGEARVVETLLYTKLLSRAIGEIRKKERANWPGSADAERYVAALEAARRQIWSRQPRPQRLADRRQKLWIDFVAAPGAAFVALGAFEMEERDGEVRVLRRETLALLELSRDYVRRNLELIARDALQLDAGAAAALLGPLP